MRNETLKWDSWKIEGLADLKRYLTENSEGCIVYPIYACEDVYFGDNTVYVFSDFIDVILSSYNDGRGQITVLGRGNGLEERFDELKKILGYKKLRAV